jgi:ankyrin repeat protein
MLESIPADIANDSMRLLKFLVHTKQPLTLMEAVEVIATQTDEEPRGFDPKRRLFRETDVLRHCPSLVSVIVASSDGGKTREELHLAHFSVKEYLLKLEQFDLICASIVITRTCLSYLTGIKGSFDNIEQDFPMARYAAKYWMDYATLAETSEDLAQTTIEFLENEATFQRWCRLYNGDINWNSNAWQSPLLNTSRLYYACLGDLQAATTYMLEKGADVNVEGDEYGYALQASSRRGNGQVVRLLLEKGANINACGGYFDSALHAALSGGHMEVAQLLLNEGANVNADGIFGNPLHAASKRGDRALIQLLLRETIQLLLDKGAVLNSESCLYGSALLAASGAGCIEVVQFLLDKGANIEAMGGGFRFHRRGCVVSRNYGNSLHAASHNGSYELVQLLLVYGTDVKTKSGNSNALYIATPRSLTEIVQLHLDKSADVNAKGGEYGSALQAALMEGYSEIMQLLSGHLWSRYLRAG